MCDISKTTLADVPTKTEKKILTNESKVAKRKERMRKATTTTKEWSLNVQLVIATIRTNQTASVITKIALVKAHYLLFSDK